MATVFKVGKFSIDQTSSTTAVTGVGFKPTALIFFNLTNRSDGQFNSGTTHDGYNIGFAANDGTKCYTGWQAVLNADSHSSERSFYDDYAFMRIYSDVYGGFGGEVNVWGAIDGASNVQSWDADGFTLSHDVDYAADYNDIKYIAIKAPNATVQVHTTPGATGAQSYTGYGFEPDALILCYGRCNVDTKKNDDGHLGFAFTDGSTSYSYTSYDQNGVGAVNCSDNHNGTEIIDMTWAERARLTSLDADGWTANWQESASSTLAFGVLALGGVNAYVGTLTLATDTTQQDITGVGFEGDGIIWTEMEDAAYHAINSGNAEIFFSLGAADEDLSEVHAYQQLNNGSSVSADADSGMGTDAIGENSHNESYISKTSFVAWGEDGFSYQMDDASPGYKATYLVLQVIETDFRTRLVKYLHNTYQSGKLGRTVVRDLIGRDVPPTQIDPDNWLFSGGFGWPTPMKYTNLLEDPNTFYVESIKPTEDSADIETNRESFFESIMRKLSNK